MYKIIGADRRTYGPLSVEHLRRWLAEGRIHPQTPAQAEGDSQWKTIADFAEFQSVQAPAPPAVPEFKPPDADAKSPRTITRSKALSCFIINQFATPGLGSLLGGRILSGSIELVLSGVGFVFLLVWMMKFFYAIALKQLGEAPAQTGYAGWGEWGLIAFGAGWLLSLVTSISLWRGARPDPPKPAKLPP